MPVLRTRIVGGSECGCTSCVNGSGGKWEKFVILRPLIEAKAKARFYEWKDLDLVVFLRRCYDEVWQEVYGE